MRTKTAWIILLLVLVAQILNRAYSEEKSKSPRQQRREQKQMADALKKKLLSVPPVVFIDDSICLQGSGGFGLVDSMFYAPKTLPLQTGRITLCSMLDFDNYYLYYILDLDGGFEAARAVAQKASSSAIESPHFDAAWKEAYRRSVDRLKQALSPADLEIDRHLTWADRWLAGDLSFSVEQRKRFEEPIRKGQRCLEELAVLLKKRQAGGASAELDSQIGKVLKAYYQAQFENPMLLGLGDTDFLTTAQLKALNLDWAGQQQRSVSAAVSSEDIQEVDPAKESIAKSWEANTWETRTKMPIKFELAGVTGGFSGASFPFKDGLLCIWHESLPCAKGSLFFMGLDRKQPWAVYQAAQIQLLGKEPVWKNHVEAYTHAESESVLSYALYRNQLKAAGITLTPEREAQLSRMQTEEEALLQTFHQAILDLEVKPREEAAQRALLLAMQRYMKKQWGNQLLREGRGKDSEGLRKDIPWFLTLEEHERVYPPQNVLGSSVQSGGGGMIQMTLREVGKKQYVGLQCSESNAGAVADAVEEAVQKYYHQRDFILELDTALEERPVKGTVEGKSAEELMQSFALRTGLKLTQDSKQKHVWRLDP